MAYKMLMRNVLTVADYTTPTNVIETNCERLIVERREEGGDFLTITEAGRCELTETEIPEKLPLGVTLVGTLIRTDPERNHETFIFNRALPSALAPDLPTPFFPTDGCVEVQWRGEEAHLRASGRHFHDLSETGAVIHRPEPFEDSSNGKTWLFDAIRVPWKTATPPKKSRCRT
ncbi:MAG: hypothetical protein ABJJ53_02935 [Sulfitobacter sp.]